MEHNVQSTNDRFAYSRSLPAAWGPRLIIQKAPTKPIVPGVFFEAKNQYFFMG